MKEINASLNSSEKKSINPVLDSVVMFRTSPVQPSLIHSGHRTVDTGIAQENKNSKTLPFNSSFFSLLNLLFTGSSVQVKFHTETYRNPYGKRRDKRL